VKRSREYILVSGLAIAFGAGVAATTFVSRLQTPRLDEPIEVDFCFLHKNSALFIGRKFVTRAEIFRTIEGASLSSDNCPDSFSNFVLPQSIPPELDAAFRKFPLAGSKLQITFDGTIEPLPFLDRFREHRELPPAWWSHRVIIERVISVEATD
jgi:hypothetical protein